MRVYGTTSLFIVSYKARSYGTTYLIGMKRFLLLSYEAGHTVKYRLYFRNSNLESVFDVIRMKRQSGFLILTANRLDENNIVHYGSIHCY